MDTRSNTEDKGLPIRKCNICQSIAILFFKNIEGVLEHEVGGADVVVDGFNGTRNGDVIPMLL